MAGKVNPIPSGYHSVTPYLTSSDASRAIEFYKQAFGAQEVSRMPTPNGKIGHAELKIGDSMIMISDDMRGASASSPQSQAGPSVGIFLYIDDIDSVFNRAVGAGAKAEMPPQDMFWGDRYGKLTDPFGVQWALATHTEDIQAQEMEKRAREAMAKMGQGQAAGQGSGG